MIHVIVSCVSRRFGSRHWGFPVEQAALDVSPEAPCGDTNMQEYLDLTVEHNHLQKPEYGQSAAELYLKVKETAQLWIEERFIVMVEHLSPTASLFHNTWMKITLTVSDHTEVEPVVIHWNSVSGGMMFTDLVRWNAVKLVIDRPSSLKEAPATSHRPPERCLLGSCEVSWDPEIPSVNWLASCIESTGVELWERWRISWLSSLTDCVAGQNKPTLICWHWSGKMAPMPTLETEGFI